MAIETSPAISALIKALEELPGYGPRSAQRAAFFLLAPERREKLEALKKALEGTAGGHSPLPALPHLVRGGALPRLRR